MFNNEEEVCKALELSCDIVLDEVLDSRISLMLAEPSSTTLLMDAYAGSKEGSF